jgi:hypothetical protein
MVPRQNNSHPGNENVLWLQISVENIQSMAERKPFQQLVVEGLKEKNISINTF